MNISFHKQLLILLAIASISCCTVTYSSWFNDLFKDVSWGMNIDVNQDENSVIVVINVSFNIDQENINIEINDKIIYLIYKFDKFLSFFNKNILSIRSP